MRGNVYTPGAGHYPPVLAGRQQLLQTWAIALNEMATRGRVRSRDLILVGPRGVGKTSAMTALALAAQAQDFEVVDLQAIRGQGGMVTGLNQRARQRIESGSGPWTRARRSLDRLASVSVGVAGVSVGMGTHRPETHPMVDASTLAEALADVALEVRADHPRGGLLITLDEMQMSMPSDLTLLAGALHRLNVNHPDAPVAFVATGLPHTADVLTEAGVTHPDRLFVVESLPTTLAHDDAAYAIVEAARKAGVVWEPAAVDAVLAASTGYPAHLQVFADAAWHVAPGPGVITLHDAQQGIGHGAESIRAQTWEPAWSRLSDRQVEYLAAVAILGGQASAASIVDALDRKPSALSRVRDQMIRSGLVHAPRRGQIRLTDPLFGRFILDSYDSARLSARVNITALSQMRDRIAVRAGMAEGPPAIESVGGDPGFRHASNLDRGGPGPNAAPSR